MSVLNREEINEEANHIIYPQKNVYNACEMLNLGISD